MKLKHKILSLAAITALVITNAAFAGNSAKIGYASDYFYRGAQKAEESLQASLGLKGSLGGLSTSLHACSNQAVDSGNDSYHMGAGVAKAFADDLISAYAGVNHFEDVPGNSLSEVELRASYNGVLSPSVSVYRNFDESLYTVEVGASHGIETELVDITLGAVFGNTELSQSVDVDYYTLGLDVSKSISDNATVVVSTDFVDADNIDDELVVGASVVINF
jgi:hypothetical protein